MAYTTQTYESARGFNFLRFIAGVLVVTLVAGVAAGAVMLSPLSNTARGLTFHSSLVDRGSLVSLPPGVTASVTLRFRNSGFAPWERGGSGTQVDLAVKGDSVEFAKAGMAVGWLADNRIATTTESVVPPGAVGTFTFDVRAPAALGLYRIPVQLVVDGVTWLEDQETFVVVASDFGFHSELIDQSKHPTLRAGETSNPIVVKLRNTGTRAWVRGKADQQVNLGLDGEASLKALAIGWPSADRVAIQSESAVAPGDAATFAFRVRAPVTPGTYALQLRPVVDGVTWLEGEGESIVTLVTVTGASGAVPQTASASFTSSASVAPLSVSSGEMAVITAAFTSASASTALVGLEVYTPGGTALAFQKWFDMQTFAAGEMRTYPVVWQVPANAALGMYSVNLRAYAPGWKSLFTAKDAAATFAVAAPVAASATAAPNSATAAPTSGSGEGQTGPTPTPAPSAAPSAAPSFSSSATVTPGSVTVGGAVSVSASFTSATAMNALVSVSIYQPGSAIAVKQQSFDNQGFAAGQTRSYPVTWSVPASATTGTYRVSLGVFSPGYGTQYSWRDSAATFAVAAVTASPTPTPIATATPIASSPAPTPTPTSSPTASPTPSPTPAPTPTLPPATSPPVFYSLQISSSPNGSSPSALAGNTVTGGIYVFVLPESGVTQVRFFMDGLLVRTESFAPFPLAGDNGGVLNPFDTTTLVNGPHTLIAQVDRSGGTDVLTAGFTVANQATPSPTPAPTAVPTPAPSAPPSNGCPSPAYTRLINVSNPTELRTAVEVNALPGDRIVMAPGVYNMTSFLTVLRDGTQANPIQLVGPRNAILDFGGVNNFRFLQLGDYDGGSTPGANWWILAGFTHRNANFGIALWNSNNNVLCDLLLDNHGQQAIAIKGPLGSSDNIIRDNEIRNTGRTLYQYGEGIYVGAGSLLPGGNNAWSPSNRNWIYKNKIGPNVTADHVDIKPTTEGNLVEGNISDATGFRFREVSGSAIHGVYTQSRVVSAVLRNNIITNLSNIDGSTGTRAGFFNFQGNNVSYHGNSVTGVGYQYGYRSDGGTGNVIGCDNTAVGGAFANIPCQ